MILGYLLPKDKSFELKYFIDGTYVNDPEEDSYAHNEFAGSKNSVLELYFVLYSHLPFNVWMWIVIYQSKIVKSKVKDIFHFRIYNHFW